MFMKKIQRFLFIGGLFCLFFVQNSVHAFTGPPSGCTPATCTNGPLSHLFSYTVKEGVTLAGVSGSMSSDTDLSTGGNHSCVLLPSGKIKCWGYNDAGQLGNGTITQQNAPVFVSGIHNAVQVYAGYNNTTCAVLSTGEVKCWGNNQYGQLGNGNTTNSSTPVSVSGITNAIQISTCYNHSCAVLSTGEVKCWGYNNIGQLGIGNTTNSSAPVPVSGITTATEVSVGAEQTCALLTDGTVKCWGAGYDGRLGQGSASNSSSPVTVSGISNAVNVKTNHHTCAALADGTAKCWGYNAYAQLGNGGTSNSATPVLVNGITNARKAMAASWVSCAVLSDNTVKCWGWGSTGHLGNGNTINYTTPVNVLGFIDCPPMTAGGITYPSLAIGNQCWTAINMKHTPSTGSWDYSGGSSNNLYQGLLYTWSAVMNGAVHQGAQGICASGWRVPAKSDFETLHTLAPTRTALENLGWNNYLYPGLAFSPGSYGMQNTHFYHWSSTEYNIGNSWHVLWNKTNETRDITYSDKNLLISLKCIKNDTVYHSGEVYTTVQVGTQVWTERMRHAPTAGSSWCDGDSCSTAQGRYYNWTAAQTLCPTGYRVPSSADFTTLLSVSGATPTGLANVGWFDSVYPGYFVNGTLYNEGAHARHWSSESPKDLALSGGTATVHTNDVNTYGFSVRCIKN
jgi:uncharacterized protein (TIGR02145 family)